MRGWMPAMFCFALAACAEAQPGSQAPAEALAYQIGSRLIKDLLAERDTINRLTLKRPSAAELEGAMQAMKKAPDLHFNRLAVVDLEGKVLVCEPEEEAEQVGARPLYRHILNQIAKSGREFITQARLDRGQMLTYDVFLPLRKSLDPQSEVTGFFHANIEPTRSIARSVESLQLKSNEHAYVLTDQGWKIYHGAPGPRQDLRLLDADARKTQSRYRVLWRRMFEDETGSESLTTLAGQGLGVFQHRLGWQHYRMAGTTWVVLHDKVSERVAPDLENPLTGTWQAFDAEAGSDSAPEVVFSASVVQDATWWRMRAVATDWSFSSHGRFIDERLTSSRLRGKSADGPHVFLVNGRYSPETKKMFIRVYWQMDKYNVSVQSYELVRLKGRAASTLR